MLSQRFILENVGLLIIFWYGILHAFGPDHLTAIADFSVGKNKAKTILITALFAIGHGAMLFVFANILNHYAVDLELLQYGDLISSSVLLLIGAYFIYMVAKNKIQLKRHIHNNKEHIHIYFGEKHNHNTQIETSSAFTLGTLMGIGGVRGMLITLSVVQSQSIDFTMVLAFTLGVMLIFSIFGGVMLYINQNLLNNKTNIKRVFSAIGIISMLVGLNMILS